MDVLENLEKNGRCDMTIEEAKKFAEEDPKINGFTVNTNGGKDKSSGVYSVWFVINLSFFEFLDFF